MAKTFGAALKAIYVDTGYEQLEYPEEAMDEELFEGVHPSVKGLVIAKTMCERNGVECDVEVVKGGVAKRIVAEAIEWEADMIVIGDTGQDRAEAHRTRLGCGDCRQGISDTCIRGQAGLIRWPEGRMSRTGRLLGRRK
jgi:nucleotide-binding universal stress UspA family protein